MAQDPTTQRDEGARDTTRTENPERQRNLETGREPGTRQSALARRGQLFGTAVSPFSLMRRMADDIERLFSNVDSARVGYGLMSPQRLGTGYEPWRSEGLMEAMWAPQVETFRKDDKLVVRADLPGLTKDNVTIEVEDGVLMISGERSDESRDERDDYYRTERSYGRFFRAIELPEGVNEEQVDATFKDGVLEVTIPAPKVTSPRKRQVKIR